MKTKDLLTITTVALGTAALTVAAFLANPLEAGNAPDPLKSTIATPVLVANGIEMTLASTDHHDFKAGEQPAFELKVVNTLPQTSEVSVRLILSASAPASPLSRTLQIPSILWQQEQSLTLGPRETKSITIATRTNLPVNKNISVSLAAAQVDRLGHVTAADREIFQPGIVAMRFSTTTPQAAPALASTP